MGVIAGNCTDFVVILGIGYVCVLKLTDMAVSILSQAFVICLFSSAYTPLYVSRSVFHEHSFGLLGRSSSTVLIHTVGKCELNILASYSAIYGNMVIVYCSNRKENHCLDVNDYTHVYLMTIFV